MPEKSTTLEDIEESVRLSDKGKKIKQRIMEQSQPDEIKTPEQKVKAAATEKLSQQFEDAGKNEKTTGSQIHMPGYNFVGINTKMIPKFDGINHVPINYLDWQAMLHDVAYSSKDANIRRVADIRFLKSVGEAYGRGIVSDVDLAIASTMIKAKMFTEDASLIALLGVVAEMSKPEGLPILTIRQNIAALTGLAALTTLFKNPPTESSVKLSDEEKFQLEEIEFAQQALVMNLKAQGFTLNSETGEINKGEPEDTLDIENANTHAKLAYGALFDEDPESYQSLDPSGDTPSRDERPQIGSTLSGDTETGTQTEPLDFDNQNKANTAEIGTCS